MVLIQITAGQNGPGPEKSNFGIKYVIVMQCFPEEEEDAQVISNFCWEKDI